MTPVELTSENLLESFDTLLIRAGGGKRFLNYILDYIAFILCFVVIGITGNLSFGDGFSDGLESINPIIDRIVTYLCYGLFMFLQEWVFRGRSIGKFITGTMTLNLDGSKITTSKAMTRALSRLVPFETFSALGSPCDPWHDRWTDTMVIDIKRSSFLPESENN
ncbi:MAG: RDD family protein [Ferruginibacter sp.]